MEDVLLVVGMLLAVYGLCDLVGRLAFRLLFPKNRHRYLLVPLCGAQSDVEYTARDLSAAHRFFPSQRAEPLLLDCGLDEESRQLAVRVCEELGMLLCCREDLCEILTEGLQERQDMV